MLTLTKDSKVNKDATVSQPVPSTLWLGLVLYPRGPPRDPVQGPSCLWWAMLPEPISHRFISYTVPGFPPRRGSLTWQTRGFATQEDLALGIVIKLGPK